MISSLRLWSLGARITGMTAVIANACKRRVRSINVQLSRSERALGALPRPREAAGAGGAEGTG